MPTIHDFGDFRIYIYFDDHNPPHFHIVTPEGSALISIETLEVLKGDVDKKIMKTALAWASNNKITLEQKWNEFNPTN